MALDFYHGHGSPYGWRVWLALEAKQVPHNVKILSFQAGDTRKPEFVAVNPRHTVPTIAEDGWALWESQAILEYLDERYDTGVKLYPGDAKAKARIRRLIREAEEHLGLEAIDPITDEYFGKGGAAPDPEKVDKAKAKLREELEYFAKEL
jgi:glutathione S-transferase